MCVGRNKKRKEDILFLTYLHRFSTSYRFMYVFIYNYHVENDNECAEKIGFLDIEQDYARYAKMQNI